MKEIVSQKRITVFLLALFVVLLCNAVLLPAKDSVSPVCDGYRRHMELAPRKDIQFAAFPAGSCGQLESCKNHSESSSLAFPSSLKSV